jgi:type IV secretory pathway TrbF-like protein
MKEGCVGISRFYQSIQQHIQPLGVQLDSLGSYHVVYRAQDTELESRETLL